MKLNTVLAMSICVASIAAFGIEVRPSKKPITPERRALMLKATGGMITKPGVGKIAVVNAQSIVSDAAISNVIGKLVFQTRFTVEVTKGSYTMYVPPTGYNAAIVITNDSQLPMSVVSVENLWGLVNVGRLGEKNLESRFMKEFVRVSTLALGGAHSQFSGSPLNSVGSAEMLDKYVVEDYTFDCRQCIIKNLVGLGLAPVQQTSYKNACIEGWAPAPTNDVQKAIWDKVHALPTEPLTIEPEKAKVKE